MSHNTFNLERFIEAQEKAYHIALQELREGRKRTHWVWYVFPQLKGLGHSQNSQFFGIDGLEEARAYAEHPILGQRLREVAEILLKWPADSVEDAFGYIDTIKLRSCMTLFDIVAPDDIFSLVLNHLFNGQRCKLTMRRLEQ